MQLANCLQVRHVFDAAMNNCVVGYTICCSHHLSQEMRFFFLQQPLITAQYIQSHCSRILCSIKQVFLSFSLNIILFCQDAALCNCNYRLFFLFRALAVGWTVVMSQSILQQLIRLVFLLTEAEFHYLCFSAEISLCLSKLDR